MNDKLIRIIYLIEVYYLSYILFLLITYLSVFSSDILYYTCIIFILVSLNTYRGFSTLELFFSNLYRI